MNVNLVLLKKDGSTEDFALPSGVTVIGRGEDSNLCIPLMIVSRKHCQINIEQNKLSIRNLGSSNGTIVNGKRIEESVINSGDLIQIGPVSFAVQVDGVPTKDSAIFAPTKRISNSDDISELNAVADV